MPIVDPQDLFAENVALQRGYREVGDEARELRAENERLQTEREHLIEAAHQIQSRLTVSQTHEAGWRERAERAEAALDQVRAVVKTGIPVDRADALAAWRRLETACQT